MRAILPILLLLPTLAAAQAGPHQAYLVVEPVTVMGKDGRPITNLTAADFTLSEDRQPQKIMLCEFQTLRNGASLQHFPAIPVEVDSFRRSAVESLVAVNTRISGWEAGFARRQGAAHALIDYVLEIQDSRGQTVRHLRDQLNLPLADLFPQWLDRQPIAFDAAFLLPPGSYLLKLVARNNANGRTGTYWNGFTVPAWTGNPGQPGLSSVVLGNERNGEKLVPSVTRVFETTQDLYVSFEVYAPNAVASVSLYRDSTLAFQSPPAPAAKLLARIPLGALPPGRYDCRVTVTDAGARRTVSWNAPIRIVTPAAE